MRANVKNGWKCAECKSIENNNDDKLYVIFDYFADYVIENGRLIWVFLFHFSSNREMDSSISMADLLQVAMERIGRQVNSDFTIK